MKKKAIKSNSEEVQKKKTRPIVSWSQEEDDILRKQIHLHGTESWGIIASNFKDKTTRQCRRRWFTYLNSDFKKGGWSPDEDMLLCEAQKVYGNRWTEIAKVVSGRTDNAVKNRFSTLCKKRAKLDEAFSSSNSSPSSYINLNNKRVLSQDGPSNNDAIHGAKPLKKSRSNITESPMAGEFGSPFAVLAQCVLTSETGFGSQTNLESVNVLEEILKHDMYESSQGSSEYSTESTTMSNVQCNITDSWEDLVPKTDLDMQLINDNGSYTSPNEESIMLACEYLDLPFQATPMFRALAATIPSPKFSESEKHFLMKTLGIDSMTTNQNTNPSQSPQCKRSLFNNP